MQLPQLRLYNTESRTLEKVVPIRPGHITMYTCGPTVYNYAHIGNFRTYVFEDLLRRTLRFFGYSVEQAMNITDVDDKTIRGALAEGVSLSTFTERFETAFFEDLRALHIEKVEHYPSAVAHIPDMIAMISYLLEEKIAYQGADKSIYFNVHAFPRYGRLSHLKLDELEAGKSNRVSADEYEKATAADFVLWKAYDEERDGAIFWESPFGRGRPGWHIECSAMARKVLGDTIDIHCGGVDNIFPHHENEIAQSECVSHAQFVNLWLHSEHLLVDGKKMAKSAGNFYTLRDLFERGYTGEEVRYLLLQTHYRTQLNFTFEGLESARSTLKRVSDFIKRLHTVRKREETSPVIAEVLAIARARFAEGIANDLNISESLAALFECIRLCNSDIDAKGIAQRDVENIKAFLAECDTVIGCLPLEEKEESIPKSVLEAVEKRAVARKEKNWAVADEMRRIIAEHGYEVEDTPTGPLLKKR